MNKLIKISDTHYVLVDDCILPEAKDICVVKDGGVWKLNFYPLIVKDNIKITHSTEVIDGDGTGACFISIKHLSLSEVEEALYGYSVEKMAEKILTSHKDYKSEGFSDYQNGRLNGIIEGFKAHQELVKDKLFTIEDMENMFILGGKHKIQNPDKFLEKMKEIIQSLLPKTEWEVEFDEQGKLRLL